MLVSIWIDIVIGPGEWREKDQNENKESHRKQFGSSEMMGLTNWPSTFVQSNLIASAHYRNQN